ncbi:MAG TPA: TolC family protein [Polyangiaceae bacterium]|nr:TolC family protein [Polyangiaceae bacterium]
MKNKASIAGAALALIVALVAPRSAHATQPLQEFIDRASSQSFDARESNALVSQREAEADAALGGLLPTASARGVYTRNQYEVAIPAQSTMGASTKPIVIQRHNQLDGFLQLDVPLVNVSNYHRYKSGQALAQSTKEQRAAISLDVGRSVTRAYFNFLGANALVRSAELSLKATEDNLRVVEARRDAGAATELDRERARANVERARQDVADAKLMVDLAARQLETLSGLTPTPAESFPVDDLHDEAPVATWLSQAEKTPLAKSAKSAQLAAQEARKAADTALYPTLAGSAQEHFTNAGGFAGRNAFYTLQLVAQVRFDYALIAQSRAQAFAADASGVRSERTVRSLQDATYEAYRRVETGIVKSRSARAQAAAAARASSLSSERYAAGVATQLDVTQAQRDAFLADAARIQADADLSAARAQLRLSVGEAPPPTNAQNSVPLESVPAEPGGSSAVSSPTPPPAGAAPAPPPSPANPTPAPNPTRKP